MGLIMITITCVLVVTISAFPSPDSIYENNPNIVPGVFISVETLRELQAKAQQNTDNAKQSKATSAIDKSSEIVQQIIPAPPAEVIKPAPAVVIQAPSPPPPQPKQVTLPVLETFYANAQKQEPITSRKEEDQNQALQNFFIRSYQAIPVQPEKPAQGPPPQFLNQAQQSQVQPEPALQQLQAVQIQGDQHKPLTNIPTLLSYSPNAGQGSGGPGTLYAVVPVSNPNNGGYQLLQAQPFRGNFYALNSQN